MVSLATPPSYVGRHEGEEMFPGNVRLIFTDIDHKPDRRQVIRLTVTAPEEGQFEGRPFRHCVDVTTKDYEWREGIPWLTNELRKRVLDDRTLEMDPKLRAGLEKGVPGYRLHKTIEAIRMNFLRGCSMPHA